MENDSENCLVIGYKSMATGHACVVIGDNQRVTGVSQVAVGERLFDEPIPDKVRRMILAHPNELNWLFQVVVREFEGVFQPGIESLKRIVELMNKDNDI